MKKWLAAFAAVGLICAGAAFAQSFPGLFITSPIGTEQINVVNGGPSIASVFIRQVRDAAGYTTSTPSTGFTNAFAAGQSQMQIGGASTLATGTITLTALPVDGQMNCFYTKPAITALTLQVGTAGQTLNDAVTAAAATTRYCYLYTLATTTWNRFQ
jgi:hypothetical protein